LAIDIEALSLAATYPGRRATGSSDIGHCRESLGAISRIVPTLRVTLVTGNEYVKYFL
jgi:hypothetical protein